MRLVCPSCGAVHSAEAFLNDEAARQTILLMTKLKGKLPELVFGYLALFRSSSGKGLKWTKAFRLLSELYEMTTAEFISWDGKKQYYNHIMYWEQALEKIIDKPPKQIPLENHNYLRAVAYGIADSSDAKQEKEREFEKSRRVINDRIEYTDEEKKQITELIEQTKRKLKMV